jgi:hypothetical protein
MILRMELRRSTAPVAGIGFLVVSLGLLYSLSGPWGKRTAPWDEQWIGLAQWTRYLALFVWPLAMGVGAWQGLRDKRSNVTELFAVAGIALLGMGVGHLLPSPVTPPVLAVATLAAQFAVLQSGWPQLLTPAFDSVDITVFTTVAVPVTLTQVLWFTGIGATGVALFVASRARTRVAALLPMALAAVVAVPILSGVDSPVVADPDARALVCDDDGPRVCVTRAHADYLPTLVGPAREALTLLRKLPSPPTSVVESPAQEGDYQPPPPDVVPVFLDPQDDTDPATIRMAVLSGSNTPMCGAEDWPTITRMVVARTVAAAWFTGEPAPLPGWTFAFEEAHKEIQQAWQAFQALPAAEQTARVVALREAAIYCRGELTP